MRSKYNLIRACWHALKYQRMTISFIAMLQYYTKLLRAVHLYSSVMILV